MAPIGTRTVAMLGVMAAMTSAALGQGLYDFTVHTPTSRL